MNELNKACGVPSMCDPESGYFVAVFDDETFCFHGTSFAKYCLTHAKNGEKIASAVTGLYAKERLGSVQYRVRNGSKVAIGHYFPIKETGEFIRYVQDNRNLKRADGRIHASITKHRKLAMMRPVDSGLTPDEEAQLIAAGTNPYGIEKIERIIPMNDLAAMPCSLKRRRIPLVERPRLIELNGALFKVEQCKIDGLATPATIFRVRNEKQMDVLSRFWTAGAKKKVPAHSSSKP